MNYHNTFFGDRFSRLPSFSSANSHHKFSAHLQSQRHKIPIPEEALNGTGIGMLITNDWALAEKVIWAGDRPMDPDFLFIQRSASRVSTVILHFASSSPVGGMEKPC
jgi:hypothetical protein